MRLQQRQHRATIVGVDRASQGQVKTKVFEDVRVAPSIEILDLTVAQVGAKSLLPLVQGQGTTKPVECHHAIRRQPVESGARLARDDGNEPCERFGGRVDLRERWRKGGKWFEFRRQIRFGERGQETKRRLQCGVKSVFARLPGELSPLARSEPNVLRVAEASAGVAIITEKAGTEAIEGGTGGGGEKKRACRVAPVRL